MSTRLDHLLRSLELQSLTARSVLGSALLGAGSRGLRVAVLVYLAESFGISAGSARVALSRMLAVGEVELANGRYRLAGRMLERQAAQQASRHPPMRAWDGSWTMLVARQPIAAKALPELRSALAQLHLAAYGDGVWMRPANLVLAPLPPAQALIDRHLGAFVAHPQEPARQLAARLWDLTSWARRARALRDAMVEMADDLAAHRIDALAPGFMVSATVMRHMWDDPLLPPALLPQDWPGVLLRSEFERHDRSWQLLLAELAREKAQASTASDVLS